MLPQQQPQSNHLAIQNQETALATLPEQLKQQRDYHLSLAVKTDNPKEITKLIDATYGRKLASIELQDEQDFNKVINLVSYWRTLIGAIKDTHPAQLRVESAYLVENYPTLTFQDINLAMDCLIQQKLDLRLPFVITFSTLFMGQVLDAYRRYKAQEINKIGEQVTPPTIEYKLSPAQKVAEMKDMIRMCHDHVKDGCNERFFNRMVYEFLRKTGKLILNDQVILDGKKYCEEKMKHFRHKGGATLREIVNGIRKSDQDAKKDRENAIRQHKIDYCLIYFFSTHNLDEVLDSVSEQHYQDQNTK
jgi:hypothetical protein